MQDSKSLLASALSMESLSSFEDSLTNLSTLMALELLRLIDNSHKQSPSMHPNLGDFHQADP